GRARVDLHVAAVDPPQLSQALQERRVAGLPDRIVRGQAIKHANARQAAVLLRACRERPCGRTSEKGDEIAALHSTTSSARASSLSGIWRPSALAVLRLITNANLMDCITGRSAGFSPLRIRPA